MGQRSSAETHELLIGTWTAMALLANALFESGALSADETLALFTTAAALASDRRRVALDAMGKLIRLLQDSAGQGVPPEIRGTAPRSH